MDNIITFFESNKDDLYNCNKDKVIELLDLIQDISNNPKKSLDIMFNNLDIIKEVLCTNEETKDYELDEADEFTRKIFLNKRLLNEFENKQFEKYQKEILFKLYNDVFRYIRLDIS
jgi:hypothetical protein